MDYKNYWLEKRRRRRILDIAPDIEKYLGISQSNFLGLNREKQDEIIDKYIKKLTNKVRIA